MTFFLKTPIDPSIIAASSGQFLFFYSACSFPDCANLAIFYLTAAGSAVILALAAVGLTWFCLRRRDAQRKLQERERGKEQTERGQRAAIPS
jgi:hypothetical protein